MKKKACSIIEYNITGDENFMRELYPVPYELEVQLEKLYKLAIKGKKTGIKKLTDFILKYPQVPALKNYLSVLYNKLNLSEKAYEVNHWIVAEHPDYLFGKLNLAAEYFFREEYHKMPEILGESMELKQLYPQRDTFHISEVTGFLKIASLYFSAIGDFEQAKVRVDILNDIAPDSDEYETAENQYNLALMQANFLKMQDHEENEILVNVKKTVLTAAKKPPAFTHNEISFLYENDFSLDNTTIAGFLELPRQSLIDDLNKVLEDSIIRFNYFNTKAENGEYDDKTNSFLIHALFILSEIKATESLNNVLEVLRQDEDYIELYLGNILTEYIWLVLYKITSSDLTVCKQFMLEPGICTYSKLEVAEVANQVALHQPERREEVIAWFGDVFRFYLNAGLKDNVIDSTLLGMLVNCVLDINGVELLPEIEKLYDKELVDYDSCGDIEEVKQHFVDDKNRDYKRDIISIFEIYKEIRSWGNDNIGSDNNYDENDFVDIQSINTDPKIGRNDPCPCGSGKKYKKCCLNK